MAATDKQLKFGKLGTVALLAAVSAVVACGPPPVAVIVKTVPAPMPQNESQPADELHVDQVIVPTKPVTPLSRPGAGSINRVTLTATNANVRELLPVLASAAGISLIMGADVRGRVSVYLQDVPAIEALRAVIEEAELTVGMTGIPIPFGPVVFYQLPVNINTASAAVITARFGVSPEVAQWIVRAAIK